MQSACIESIKQKHNTYVDRTVETSGGRGDSDGINEVKRSLCRYIPLGLLYLWGIKTTTNDSDTLAGWLSLPYCAV